jgi:dolichol-phosphate mannosyltransferase
VTARPQTPQLSIVLPAYEEAVNLEFLLPKLHSVAKQLTPDYELLVVDTETPRDASPEICHRLNARYVPRRGGNLYGHAVRTGQAEARGRSVVFMDADGSHDPEFLPSLWQYREQADLVIASRYVPGGKTENSALLVFMSLTVNYVFRIFLGLNVFDVSNSFRLYRGEELRALQLRCNHFDIVEEMLVKLVFSHQHYRVKEVPFVFAKRKAGKTKRNLVLFAIGYLVTLMRLRKLKSEARRAAH